MLRETRDEVVTFWCSSQHSCCTISKRFRANCCLEGPSSSMDIQSSKAEDSICRTGITSSNETLGSSDSQHKKGASELVIQKQQFTVFKINTTVKQNAVLFKRNVQKLSRPFTIGSYIQLR